MNLQINTKVNLDLEAIKNTEYASQLFRNESRKTWFVSSVIEAHNTVVLRPTNKSRVDIVLPIKFIKVVA